MNAAGFTSEFAPQLAAYLAFKEKMGFLRHLPNLVPDAVRRLLHRTRADRLRPRHGRRVGQRAAGPIGSVPVLDVLHPRRRPVAAGPRAA